MHKSTLLATLFLAVAPHLATAETAKELKARYEQLKTEGKKEEADLLKPQIKSKETEEKAARKATEEAKKAEEERIKDEAKAKAKAHEVLRKTKERELDAAKDLLRDHEKAGRTAEAAVAKTTMEKLATEIATLRAQEANPEHKKREHLKKAAQHLRDAGMEKLATEVESALIPPAEVKKAIDPPAEASKKD